MPVFVHPTLIQQFAGCFKAKTSGPMSDVK